MRSEAGSASALYFIAWIFVGNIVILNLFLAILLDSFTEDDNDEQDNENNNGNLLKKKRNSLLQV